VQLWPKTGHAPLCSKETSIIRSVHILNSSGTPLHKWCSAFDTSAIMHAVPVVSASQLSRALFIHLFLSCRVEGDALSKCSWSYVVTYSSSSIGDVGACLLPSPRKYYILCVPAAWVASVLPLINLCRCFLRYSWSLSSQNIVIRCLAVPAFSNFPEVRDIFDILIKNHILAAFDSLMVT